jgi:ankyrin repeat protein
MLGSHVDGLSHSSSYTGSQWTENKNDGESSLIDSLMFESNGFDKDALDQAIEERKKHLLNKHLTKMEKEIYLAIKYGDANKLRDLGGGEQLDLNFSIEIEKDLFYYPIQLAAAIGEAECLKLILENNQTQVDVVDNKTGTNAFWVACFYGRGECVSLLANAGVNLFNKHKETNSNGLHVAIERKHYEVANMLISSKFPLEDKKNGGLTPLLLSARDKDAYSVSEQLVKKGAQINVISDSGQSPLSQAVINSDMKLAELMLKYGAHIFHEDEKFIDVSPFIVAINNNNQPAVELFCDHGADIETRNSKGLTPLLYAALKQFDEICMYLSLRTEQVDLEDRSTGFNVFSYYLLMRKDLDRMKQLLYRGADINYVNYLGLTPLHQAIEKEMNSKIINFLLKNGANPHIEDFKGEDCCEKAQAIPRYSKLKKLVCMECRTNPSLRIKQTEEGLE